jgi:two-component system response regulator YesN
VIGTIIVDDDVETLQGLRSFIPWEASGFTILATASDGASALDLVRTHRPGLLIADITMPEMDGLTLIRESQGICPELKSIILTCHEDFSYAHEAILLGVMDYMLKITLTPEKLLDSLDRIRRAFDRNQGETGGDGTFRRDLSNGRLQVQPDFFLALIEGDAEKAERLTERARLLGIGFPGKAYRTYVFFVDDLRLQAARERAAAPGRAAAAVLEILGEACGNERGVTAFAFGESACILIRWYDAEPFAARGPFAEKVLHAVQRIREKTGLSVSCCVSGAFREIGDLPRALESCRDLREAYFYSGSGTMVSEPVQWDNGPQCAYDAYVEDLVHLLHAPQDGEIARFVARLSDCGRSASVPPRAVRSLLHRLLVDVDAAASRRGFVLEHSLADADTFASCLRLFESVLKAFHEQARTRLARSSREEINRVLAYIGAHLGEPIRCETMAASVNLNGSYFSRLFKKELGVSFTEYLMRERIARSRELLARTRMSFEEITWAVGLENVSYFHRVFKRYTGMTPKQARKDPAGGPKS